MDRASLVRPSTDDDWHACVGTQAPGVWFGLTVARPHFVEGFGAIYRDTRGRWWLTMHRSAGVRRTKTAHATAKRLLAMAREVGIGEVYVIPQPGIEGAEKWVERLGFEPANENIGDFGVWLTRLQ